MTCIVATDVPHTLGVRCVRAHGCKEVEQAGAPRQGVILAVGGGEGGRAHHAVSSYKGCKDRGKDKDGWPAYCPNPHLNSFNPARIRSERREISRAGNHKSEPKGNDKSCGATLGNPFVAGC